MRTDDPTMWVYLWILGALGFQINFIAGRPNQDEAHVRHKRVIGGKEIEAGMFPWLAHLSATLPAGYIFGFPVGFEGYDCGGSILNERWIMTAAHCFTVEGAAAGIGDPTNWLITVGEVDQELTVMDGVWDFFGRWFQDPTMRRWTVYAEAIILHPHYDPDDTWENDIALVRVSEPLPVGPEHSDITQVNLPAPALGGSEYYPSLWPAKQRCIMKGWGCTSAGGPVETRARAVVLPIVDSEDCPFKPVGDNRLCAGYDSLDQRDNNWFSFTRPRTEAGICPGDSGGPLVCQYHGTWLQAGIASYTSAYVPGRVPGVFTRVSYYVDWIESAVKTYERQLEDL